MSKDKLLLQGAVEAHKAGRLDEAEKLYKKLLVRTPLDTSALLNLGILYFDQGRLEEAGKLFRKALINGAANGNVHNALGNLLARQGKLQDAIESYRRAIRLRPTEFVWNNLGNTMRDAGDIEGAIACFREAIALQPGYAIAYYNIGFTYGQVGRHAEAVAAYEEALQVKPDFAEALVNLGVCLSELGRNQEAVDRLRQAVALAPHFAPAHGMLGKALNLVRDLDGAEAAYREAIRLQPGYVDAHLNLGTLLSMRTRRAAALAEFEQVARLDPGNANLWGKLSFEKRHACDWQDYDEIVERKVLDLVRAGPTSITPFVVATVDSTAEDQLNIARTAASLLLAVAPPPLPPRMPPRRAKIRLGYLSADFQEHATAYLMAELFEKHDRSRFEVYGYSIGRADDSAIRKRLEAGFDRFADLRSHGHGEAARQIRADEVDILIDLKGYTQHARTEILVARPAPLQVNYVGYPGTMGAPFIDYIIADRFIIPPDQHRWYDEKVVTLPHCYQPNDSKRPIADWSPSRADCELPEKTADGQGFVFCGFNNPYKFTPKIFDIWMRLLRQVPGSVLWLLDMNQDTTANLQREAQARGVDPARLAFAPPLSLDLHLARQKQADLFLDTLPVNAHTTASDALWVGLPVLTCTGDTFISRVAGSLLHTIGLPELVTDSLQDYEARALELARNPARLAALKQKLTANRPASPLFDIARLTRNLERGYDMMWERCLAGEKPAAIEVVE